MHVGVVSCVLALLSFVSIWPTSVLALKLLFVFTSMMSSIVLPFWIVSVSSIDSTVRLLMS